MSEQAFGFWVCERIEEDCEEFVVMESFVAESAALNFAKERCESAGCEVFVVEFKEKFECRRMAVPVGAKEVF